MTLDEIAFQAAEDLGIRLEMVGGWTIWEAHPVPRHQKAVVRIERSIMPPKGTDVSCACFHLPDVYIRFPEGSLKRPDISVFCREPDEEDEAIMLVPEAVVEILSKGYEAKDLELGVPFYRSQGVKDVVVLDPDTGEVTHHNPRGESHHMSPARLVFACGCECSV
jgi:hypothetical protein